MISFHEERQPQTPVIFNSLSAFCNCLSHRRNLSSCRGIAALQLCPHPNCNPRNPPPSPRINPPPRSHALLAECREVSARSDNTCQQQPFLQAATLFHHTCLRYIEILSPKHPPSISPTPAGHLRPWQSLFEHRFLEQLLR